MLPTDAMAVLELFTTTRRELGVVDVAALMNRPKSTVSGWMSALERAGFLDRSGVSLRYRLGIRLATLGELARRSTSLQRAATPYLEVLARRTRETASANVLVGSEVVNAAVVESPRPVLVAGGIGAPMPVHATAAGKVLVAWWEEAEVRQLLPRRLVQFTERTILDVETFLEELALVREQGYSVAAGEMAVDLFALSAPVRDSTGRVVAALSVAAPLSRVADQDTSPLAEQVMEAAEKVSSALGFRDAVAVPQPA